MKKRVIPAIDILDGKFVRLLKGDFKKKKYFISYRKYVNFLIKKKVRYIHIVDLNGAKSGKPKNKKIILKIIKKFKKSNVRVQIGGGIRKKKYIDFYLQKGAKVIIGTSFFKKKIENVNLKKIIISIDYKDNRVFLNGWKKKDISLKKAIDEAKKSKFKYFVFTNINKDGTGKGLDIKNIKYICNKMKKKKIMFAGGFNNKEKEIYGIKNLYGIISGSFFYEKCIKE
ncbi:Phosphoribosylformimino-5-aminoimidazole carboxamide ribotide isomerase [Candidatus Vidania fulgoroideae]|nr:Phosphoribosylformimino-5-aminoimidazole carboxamide ribotide isomerase [Candidatus Vidania fulgoroideae]